MISFCNNTLIEKITTDHFLTTIILDNCNFPIERGAPPAAVASTAFLPPHTTMCPATSCNLERQAAFTQIEQKAKVPVKTRSSRSKRNCSGRRRWSLRH